MYEFTPFKKTDKLSFESFMKFPRELLTKEEYKILSPNAMLLYSVLTDRLDLSFKQITENRKIQFYDAKGNMYVIFKRDEIQERLHIKRSALDSAILQLKECNLIKEKKQGKNLPNIIYLGKTIGMIEDAKTNAIERVENQHSGKYETSSPECIKTTLHNSNNNKYINNNYKSSQSKNQKYQGRTYPPGFLDKLYTNNSLINDI
ncbi:MAG: replication initiator protein A [Clostridia bacterium]|nr:replication initiator protein A [Clostridia bacterium]